MSDRFRGPGFVLIAIFWAVFGPQSLAFTADDPSQDAIEDSDLSTTADLLRGYSDTELDAAKAALPRQPEPPPGVARPRTVTGRVYQDRNANGTREPEEPGLADVAVTDGRQLLRTSHDGGYRFRIEMAGEPHHRFVVVTRPTGYKPSVCYPPNHYTNSSLLMAQSSQLKATRK